MKTLVLGLGNSILSDDGVGLKVAAGIKAAVELPDVSILETELGGINLLELLVGYERVIIVDAIKTPEGKPGHIYKLKPDSLKGTRHTNSTHGIDFAGTLELGKKLGMDLPSRIIIFAIEGNDVYSFSENCSPEVTRAIPVCVGRVIRALGMNSN
jgi:hydrogenase maturation protease